MVRINSFNSIIEIGFALNFFFIVLTFIPLWNSWARRIASILQKKADSAKKELSAFPDAHDSAWVLLFVAGSHHTVTILVATIAALCSFILLLVAAYKPDVEINGWLMTVLLAMIFIPSSSLLVRDVCQLSVAIEKFDEIVSSMREWQKKKDQPSVNE